MGLVATLQCAEDGHESREVVARRRLRDRSRVCRPRMRCRVPFGRTPVSSDGTGPIPAQAAPHEMLDKGEAMEIEVDQKASRSLTLTEEHVEAFAQITGDRNPLHFDRDFAAGTKFGRLVLQGGLTTGLLHALVAMDMPGPGTVFLSQDWKFTAPVYIGDTITATARVLSVHETKPVTQLGVWVDRQDGGTVLEGEAWCYTFSPGAQREGRT